MTEYFEVDAEKDLKSMDTFLEDWKYYEFLKNLALNNKSIVGYRDHKYTVQKILKLIWEWRSTKIFIIILNFL